MDKQKASIRNNFEQLIDIAREAVQREKYAPHPVDIWHRKPGRPAKGEDEDQRGLESLDPAAIWQRISERHWKRESDISQIAERRKSE